MSTLYKTTTLDDTHITYDFEVEKLSEGKNWKLFGKHKKRFSIDSSDMGLDLFVLLLLLPHSQGWGLKALHFFN